MDVEWKTDRIDTPYPEYPRHFEKDDILNEETYQTFLDLYDGNDVILYCKMGGRSASSASVLIDRGFNGTVYNLDGGITSWESLEFPVKKGNDKPDTPNIPSGENVCTLNEEYSFSSTGIDTNDDVVRLGWDWNSDLNIDTWSDYYPSNTEIIVTNIWDIDGSYQVRVLTEDIVGSQSDFSDPLEILINNPPSKPTIDGPSSGKPQEQYEYMITSSDIDNNELYYYIDWGDNTNSDWIGPFQSNEQITIDHIWDEKGSYDVMVKAKDNYDAETDWETLEVNMPKSKNNIIKNIFDFNTYWEDLFSYFFSFIFLL